MYIPLNWIKEYTDLNINLDEIVENISTKVGSVEEVTDLSKKYKGITVAQIVGKEDHPNADKLGVYKVEIAEGKTVQVVAGDKTLEVGDKVAYFAPGVKVPYNAHPEKYDGIVSKVSLRGVDSEGMMASERELDLGSNHEQVMRLEEDTPVGVDFAIHFGLDDTVLDIENKALANRADLFGILGVARELSGIQGNTFTPPTWLTQYDSAKLKGKEEITVTNEIETYCKRYMAVVMENVKVKDSPTWMKVALSKVGIRPINNVVDITNYIMYLTSQPLHAFDMDKVIEGSGSKKAHILVRVAKEGESITTLDGKTVHLDTNTVVITDGEHPIGIAGVMGGQSTEVDSNTKRVIIECANFDRYNIRKTSMRLGLFTEAVTRFTKAQDPNQCESVLLKTVSMMEELAGGKVASKIYDNYIQPVVEKMITISPDRVNTVLGTQLSTEKIIKYLENIQYRVEVVENDLVVTVPTFRQDVTIAEDIYEDIGRHFGYNNIKVGLPSRSIKPNSVNEMLEFKEKVRDILTRVGGNELLTYNFIDSKVLSKYNIDPSESYKLTNPLSPELEYMRYDLLPSLLEKTSYNIDQGYSNFILYEINKGHSKHESDQDSIENLPVEREYLGVVTLNTEYTGNSYYSSKAVLSKLLEKLNVKTYSLTLLKDVDLSKVRWIERLSSMVNPNATALLTINEEYVGIVGQLSSSVYEKSKLPRSVSVIQLDMSVLIKYSRDSYGYVEPSRYPRTSQDICFEVGVSVEYKSIEEVVKRVLTDVDYVYSIEPLDIYNKEGEGVKRVTVRVNVQHRDRTLNQYDITQLRNTLDKEMEKEVGGRVV